MPSPDDMMSAVTDSPAERTGRTLEQWVGLVQATGRLQPANAPGQATHMVALTSVDDVDDELRALLRAAYEQNG